MFATILLILVLFFGTNYNMILYYDSIRHAGYNNIILCGYKLLTCSNSNNSFGMQLDYFIEQCAILAEGITDNSYY